MMFAFPHCSEHNISIPVFTTNIFFFLCTKERLTLPQGMTTNVSVKYRQQSPVLSFSKHGLLHLFFVQVTAGMPLPKEYIDEVMHDGSQSRCGL